MALSGSNYKSFARHRLVAEWTATQNIAKNQSTVTVKVFLQSVDAYGAMQAPASNAGSVKVGTTTKNFTATSQLSANQKKQLTSQSFVVSHNANGTASFNYSVTYNINVTFAGVFYGNQTVSGSGTLNTIPRASSISSIVGNQIGGNVTVNITRASSSFKHIVKYTNTAGGVSTVGENVDTSKTFTISMDDCSHLPNSTSGTAKITVDTYSGSSKIGSVTSNHTVYVPDSVKPTVEYLTAWDDEQIVRDVMVVNGAYNGTQIINISKPQVACNNVSGVYSSTIKSYEYMDGNGIVYSSQNSWFYFPNSPTTVEDLIYKGRVRDSRGRWSDWATVSVYTHYYVPPQLLGFSVWRDSNVQTKVSAYCRGWVSMIGGKNKGNWWVDVKNGDTWTTVGAIYITGENIGIDKTIVLEGSYDITKSYEFRVYFEDALLRSSTSISRISTAKTLIDLNKDIGIGIGKVHERGTLDIGGNAYLEGDLSSGALNITTPTSNTGGNQINQVMDFFRKNKSRHSGFDINGENDALRLHQYNASGEWLSAHNFHRNGSVDLASHLTVYGSVEAQSFVRAKGDIWADGNISTGSNMFINGATVHADYIPQIIWGVGATLMAGGHFVTPTKALNQCRNGWILAWSDYTNGVVNNYDWNFTLVPKSVPALNNGTGGMHCPISMTHTADTPVYSKYVYITNTQIKGNEVNNQPPLSNAVLRAVYEF